MSADWSAARRQDLRDVLTRAVDAGVDVAREYFRSQLTIDHKETRMDAVSEADTDVQETIVDVLTDSTFDGTIVGEEADARKSVPQTGFAWVIDPIDGTNNFVRGNRVWAVSIVAVQDGTALESVTALPALGDRFHTTDSGVVCNGSPETVSDRTDMETFIGTPIFGLQRRHRKAYEHVSYQLLEHFGDIRRLGTGQTTLAWVAAGEVDAAISTVPLSPWDTIAGAELVRRAGGTVTDLAGDPWSHDAGEIIATNGHRHDDILELLRD